MQLRTLRGLFTAQECRLLGQFTLRGPLEVAVNAATGHPTQDHLLFELARRLTHRGIAQDILGPNVLLWGLRLTDTADATASDLELIPSAPGFAMLVPVGPRPGPIELSIDTRKGTRTQTQIEVGSALLVPPATGWRVANSGDGARLFVASYAAPGAAFVDADGEPVPAITLSGNLGLNRNSRLSPIRGPRNAFALSETYRRIAAPDNEDAPLVAGHTDILTDLTIALTRSAPSAAVALQERLLVSVAADCPKAIYVPAGCSPPQVQAVETQLEVAWTGTPGGYLDAGDSVTELSTGMAIETAFLSRLDVKHIALDAGGNWGPGMQPCDALIVVRSGQIALRGEQLLAPALALLPAGVPVSCQSPGGAALTVARFQGTVRELARPGTSTGGPVIFCIPLAARRMAKDWRHTCRLLQATLGSLYRQSDPNWRVIVVGNEPPELTLELDDRFEFIATTRDFASGKLRDVQADAGHKRYVAEQRARERNADYIYFCDSDDLIGNDVVSYIRRHRHPYGYVVGRGVIVDEERSVVAPLPLKNDVLPLEEQTASAFAFNVDALPSIIGSAIVDTSGHTRYRANMYGSGRPMLDLPFAAMAYVRFTRENMSDIYAPRTDDPRSPYNQIRAAIAAQALPRTPALVAYYNLDGGARENSGPLTFGPKRLSVLVCTHRRPGGLQRLLETLVPQVAGRSDREIVVVNDGTHDAAYADVVARYASVLRYIPLPRSVGIAGARNRSAEQARGEFMVFTDDDCEVPPHWLDWLDATLRAHGELDVVAGTTRPLRPEEANFVGKAQAHFELLPFPHSLGPVDQCFVTACLAIRGSTFRLVGGFSTGFPFNIAGEDTDLSLRLVRSGARTRIDDDWHVYHELGRSLAAEMRRFRRYGRANRHIGNMPNAPASYRRLAAMRHHLLPAKFGEHFRRNGLTARDYDGTLFEKVRARVTAALIQTAYDRGAAER